MNLPTVIRENIIKILNRDAKNVKKNINVSHINDSVVDKIINFDFTNVYKLNLIRDLFDDIFISYSDEVWSMKNMKKMRTDIPLLYESVEVLNNIKKLSTKSAFGDVFVSSFNSVKNLIIIKTTQKGLSRESLLLEYFIGRYGINKLRKFIPNFMYTFSIFKCSRFKNQMCKTPPNFNNWSYFIALEKINGSSLWNYISSKKRSDTIVLQFVMQIILSLFIAQREIKFIHYDLHLNNILIRTTKTPQNISFQINEQTFSISTSQIPTIIDFGSSFMVRDNIPFGNVLERINKGYDIYKFLHEILFFSLDHAKEEYLDNYEEYLKNYGWIIDYYASLGETKYIENKYDRSKLYKSLGNGYLNTNFGMMSDKISETRPIHLIKWIIKNKPDLFSDFTISNSLMEKDSSILQKYSSKLDAEKILLPPSVNSVICDIKTFKSNIIRNYYISVFESINNKFGNIDKKIMETVKRLKNQKTNFSPNDLNLVKMIEEKLRTLIKSIKPIAINSVSDAFSVDTSEIDKFISVYKNYLQFFEYSKFSEPFPLKFTDENEKFSEIKENAMDKQRNILFLALNKIIKTPDINEYFFFSHFFKKIYSLDISYIDIPRDDEIKNMWNDISHPQYFNQYTNRQIKSILEYSGNANFINGFMNPELPNEAVSNIVIENRFDSEIIKKFLLKKQFIGTDNYIKKEFSLFSEIVSKKVKGNGEKLCVTYSEFKRKDTKTLLHTDSIKIFEPDSFSLIMLFDVLNKIPVYNRENYIETVEDLLDENGLLLIFEPLIDSPITHMEACVKRTIISPSYNDDISKFEFLSEFQIRAYVKRSEFKVADSVEFNYVCYVFVKIK
jgi:hypothetical protein